MATSEAKDTPFAPAVQQEPRRDRRMVARASCASVALRPLVEQAGAQGCSVTRDALERDTRALRPHARSVTPCPVFPTCPSNAL